MIISPPRETYRQTYMARALLTLLLVGFAALVYFIGAEEKSTVTPWIAAVLIAADVALWIAISKTQLTIHDEGVRRVSVFGVREIEWRSVKEYRYRMVSGNNAAGAHGGLIGVLIIAAVNRTSGGRKATTSFYLQLVGQDGTKLSVTSSFKGAYEAIGTILTKLHEQLRPQIAREIAATGSEFGPLRLSARDLKWKTKEPVPLAELEYAELASSNLLIKKRGKFLSIVSVRSDKVPNVLLLLDEMKKLGVGAKHPNQVDPLAHAGS
jgi:hypothetical protein